MARKYALDVYVDSYRQLIGYAKAIGISLLIENFGWIKSEPETIPRIIRAVGAGLTSQTLDELVYLRDLLAGLGWAGKIKLLPHLHSPTKTFGRGIATMNGARSERFVVSRIRPVDVLSVPMPSSRRIALTCGVRKNG